jgi:hypothetical protein
MDEFVINTTTAGNQDQPSVAGFRGTQFVVVWEDNGANSIKGRLFGVNGAPTANEFAVNFPGEPGTKRQLPKVIETAQGFAVTWNEQAPGGLFQVKLRTFDQDSLSGPESQVSTAETERLIRPSMTRLPDGGFAVAWADKRADERIRVQRFGADGTRTGAEFRANTTPGLHRVPMMASLTSENFLVGWRARIAGPLHLRMQLFDANGPLGGEQVPNIEITEAAMTPLDDSGRYIMAHVRSAADGEPGFETTVMQANIFDSGGAFARRFPVTSAKRIQSSWPMLAPLSGSRFLAAWTEANIDNAAAGANVVARLFSSQGPLGKVTQVNTVTGGQRFSLAAAIASGPDGDSAFFAWNDDKAGATHALKGRVLPIPARGF